MIPTDRVRQIRCLVCTVDGVLTNGMSGFSTHHDEIIFLHARDRLAMPLAAAGGLPIALITGRFSPLIAKHAREMQASLYPGITNTAAGLMTIASDRGVDPAALAYLGDDLDDLPAFARAGLPIAVADAPEAVRAQAAWTTTAAGGQGAIREVVEALLQAQGRWDAALAQYLQNLATGAPAVKMPRTEE